jgi:hypothetical protein
MNTAPMPLTEITTSAIQLLLKEMGIVNTLRFINQFSMGFGNYTEERHDLFRDMTVDDIVAAMAQESDQKSQ